MSIRPANLEDAPAIQAIYAHHVLHGVATFEEVPPEVEEMAARMIDVRDRGLPWLVAVEAGEVLGFAYAAPFRLRSGYRHTVEDAIYLAPHAQGRGVGRALLTALIAACEAAEALDLRQMVALVGDSGNAGSLALHASAGFRRAGLFEAIGRKHGRWVDVVFMQRTLNEGAASTPRAESE